MQKRGSTEDKIYKFICNNPGLNTYQIAKKLKMSGGNVRVSLTNLHKKGLIFFKFERKNPRIEKKCFAVKIHRLLPRIIKKEIKNFLKFKSQ